MSAMFEHVAKAILCEDRGNYFATCLTPKDISHIAQAAVAALREWEAKVEAIMSDGRAQFDAEMADHRAAIASQAQPNTTARRAS